MRAVKKRKNPFKINDTVRYNIGHYRWLNLVGRWPRNIDRVRYVGVVWEAEVDGVVTVKWESDLSSQTHFADNLERCGG
jgi:hypothetical protein